MLSIGSLAAKIFGSANERKVKSYRATVDAINALEPELESLSSEALRARTAGFRQQLANGASLDDLLVPAFATVREAAKRTLKQRHFDVQLIGGIVLHQGKIAEMKTGEGKTLVATLPVYLNALAGRGVHVVTVNDYLAKRDSEWMGQIYRFLGLTVGCIVHDLDDAQRQAQYACDVTYGTNNELGFDYLRDNMKTSPIEMVQFGFREFGGYVERLAATPASRLLIEADERLVPAAREYMKLLHPSPDEPVEGSYWRTRGEKIARSLEKFEELKREQYQAGFSTQRDKLARELTAARLSLAETLDPLFELKMAHEGRERAGHAYAIVDEVDSILIDEARTPLIISGPVEDRAELYNTIDTFIPHLVAEDFELDEKQRSVSLTETGNEKIEQMLEQAGLLKGSLYDIENVTVVHHVNQALKAHKLFQRDRDYIVKAGQVVIIDEFTGRMMPGRRYSEGLHQALEAKERVEIQPENQTLASITFQNYFRLYDKLAGMTGTAATEANEFMDIYGLDVVEVPTNLPVARLDEDDEIYRTANEKWDAIIREIDAAQKRKQPVLVGTVSIEKSELLSERLKKKGVPHQVLNARYHEQEAYIIAQAGVPGTVTIATNMAGRGTDIQLGGNAQMRIQQETADLDEREKEKRIEAIRSEIARNREIVLKAEDTVEIEPAKGSKPAKTAVKPGGLYVIGTERHESRRIDNQLRGRSGRQGDPGRSKFYLSLEDDLMRIFGSNRMDGVLRTLGLQEGEAIIHPWMNKSLEMAQRKVEARNFDIRKQILKYDDVMNDQRKVIFDQRIDIMAQDDVGETVADMRREVIEELVKRHIPENAYAEQWDVASLQTAVKDIFGLDLPVAKWAAEEGVADQEIREKLIEAAETKARKKAGEFGPEMAQQIEKMVLLQTLDHLWREHLVTLEHLRQVIGFRAYGQRDPLNEYKSEAFLLFEGMLAKLREAVTGQLMHIELAPPEEQPELQPIELPPMQAHHIDATTGFDEFAMADAALAAEERPVDRTASRERRAPLQTRRSASRVDPGDPATWGKVARNALCPCGSGKKYKHCHGRHD